MLLTIDHLAVCAEDLSTGAAFIEAALGVAPGAGGRHPQMG
ncbi:MAG: VOC family protein, partial [Paracoccaceae bacterium]